MAALPEPGALRNQLEEITSLDGEDDPRALYVLWVARKMYEREEIDSLEDIRPPTDTDVLASGVVIERGDDDTRCIVFLYLTSEWDAAVPISQRRRAGEIARALISDPSGFARSVATEYEPFEERLGRAGLLRRVSNSQLKWTLSVVTPGRMTAKQSRDLELLSTPDTAIEVVDAQAMAQRARALASPELLESRVLVESNPGEWLKTTAGDYDILVVPVRGLDVAEWPGIKDRSLFNMNVRFGLGRNRVRKSLDQAFGTDPEQQSLLLAYHNGALHNRGCSRGLKPPVSSRLLAM